MIVFFVVNDSRLAGSDEDLVAGLEALVGNDREVLAAMLPYLAEIDRRAIWASEGYSSMHTWCVKRFHMSDDQAYKRIRAARAAQCFPVIVERVARGELHLSAICVLAAHLTLENHREVLGRATHKSKREIEELAAELSPKPDVPSRIRALPQTEALLPVSSSLRSESTATEPESALAPGPVPTPAKVAPLSPGRYKLTVTLDREAHDDLRELQALLSHSVPSGDPAEILKRGLKELLDKARRERAAATRKPREAGPPKANTRAIPAAVTRAVWERDRSSCAFVSGHGHRCAETRLLQLHHVKPFARGGEATIENIELRCAAHNQHEAARDYGRAFMAAKRSSARHQGVAAPESLPRFAPS